MLQLLRLQLPKIMENNRTYFFILLLLSGNILLSSCGGFKGASDTNQDAKFQQWLDEGRELRSRRLFDEAAIRFDRILKTDPDHEEATVELAQTFFQAELWLEAMDWFYAVSLLQPQLRDPHYQRWVAVMNLAKGDPLLEETARKTIRSEIADFLRNYPWDWETLETARKGAVLIGENPLNKELADRIIHQYPDTPAGYQILSSLFYDGLYPIWNDPKAKITFIQRFLKDHPQSQFRETAWSYLLQSLNQAGDVKSLRSACNEWMAEDANNPFSAERAVHYLMENGIRPDSLLPLAREAVFECRGWRGKPLKHVEQRIQEGKKLYADTRLNIARVLIEMNRLAEARLWLEDGLRHCGFDEDDDETTASFHYFLGIIAEKEGEYETAFDHYINALCQGDVRNFWTLKADSAAKISFAEHFQDSEPDMLSFARKRKQYQSPVFEDVTNSAGLSAIHTSRVAWGDANSDGFDDLLLGGNRLFLNQSGKSFIEITEPCGLRGSGISGGVWADIDLDGDLDLFCAGDGGAEGGDYLFLNEKLDSEGIPHFLDATSQVGNIRDSYPSEGAAWGDLQGDGRPDLYVANYESSSGEMSQGTPDFLYINLQEAKSPLGFRFQRLSPDSGLIPPFGKNLCGRGVNWGDFDGDKDQDIYVSNYRLQENFLWENHSTEDVIDRACYYGIAGMEREGYWGHTIGSEWGDFDNDGDLDLITANLAHPRYIELSNRTCLYENRLREEGIFREVRREWGIKYEETHSDPAWGDVDADGDLDLYLTSIYPQRRSFLYLNDLQNHRFIDITYLSGVRVLNSWGCAFSDFDNDGDLDLVVGSAEGVRLFRNLGNKNHWLELDFQVPGSGFGTQVFLKSRESSQMRELSGGKGTTSQHSRTMYFGLGQSTAPVNLKIHFPSGLSIKIKGIKPDQKIPVQEP